jgi:hypothetical protein
VSTSSCGPKPGLKATGTPIKLGTINTKQLGTDLTGGSNMAKPYFDCVNANGRINGHPIQYFIETEQTQPSQIAADAKQLVQTDHVLGMVGNFSVTFTNTPTMNLYKAILKQYGCAVSGGIGSFSQMGFTEAVDRHPCARGGQGCLHGQERQRRVQGREGLQHRAALPALDLWSLCAAHPQQRRLHGYPRQRKDGGCAGLHADLGGRPSDAQYRKVAGG